MRDLEQDLLSNKQLMYYLLTVESTLLLTIGGWFFVAYPSLVTKEELQQIAPYVRDRGTIMDKLIRHDSSLDKTVAMIEKLDKKFTIEIRQLELSIARMEAGNGLEKRKW